MTYKLVSHKTGKYTVEFDNGGCRPATDVEVALIKQRDELLVALLEALEKLAKLGNGEHYGNSEGNVIAQQAIARVNGETK